MSEDAPQATETPTIKAILGQKVGMTQVFDPQGQIIPVTVIEAGPCHVTAVRTIANDGYQAVQLSFGEVKEKNMNRPQAGRYKKLNVAPARWSREFRTPKSDGFAVGQVINAGVFAPGDYVDVAGTSKGKGFAGTMKRHNFGGGPATHGQSDRQRAPGSIGSNTYPGRVFKGQRMAGHLGAERVTVQHLEVVRVDAEKNLILIQGAVPGPARALVLIQQTVKRLKSRPAATHHDTGKKEKKKEAPKAAAAKPKAAK